VDLRTRAGLELPLDGDVPKERLHGFAAYCCSHEGLADQYRQWDIAVRLLRPCQDPAPREVGLR
jgi:hypothetical protein